MRIRHLFAVLLILGLSTVGAMAQYNCPVGGGLTTGTTDYVAKTDGEALVYGGASTGTTRMDTGFFKFDTALVPDVSTVSSIEFHFYVNATNWPYFSTTPMTTDPTLFGGVQALWTDAQAEKTTGWYNYQNESSAYAAGWKMLVLGGTANADCTALLASDYFLVGMASRDTTPTYFTEVDGNADVNAPYLVVYDDPPPANDTCATAVVIPGTPGSTSYTGSTATATNAYDCSAACVGGLPHPMGDVAYTVTLPANCTICVTLNQSVMAWNGGVYMVTDCADVNGTCVAGASGWLASSVDEVFCFSDTATETYYIIVDGRDGTGAFQLDVNISCIGAPSGLTCADDGSGGVDLAWANGDTYDNVEVYENGILIATIAGSATSHNVAAPTKGYACYYVCGVITGDSACSNECCLIVGYSNVELLWDFEADDGGFIVGGTGGWQWGAPTYGPCVGGGTTTVWGTDLDADYGLSACWLLDSADIEFETKGGFICVDHCYDIEANYDGGKVWFTTDDFNYYSWEPLGGTDGVSDGSFGGNCAFVYDGLPVFTGNSGGWVTDCWDLTDPMWSDQLVTMRFAFGTDSSVVYSGWLIDNITVYNNVVSGTVACDYTVLPTSGTLPFVTNHQVTLTNTYTGFLRRIAGRITLRVGNGSFYNPWRSGFTNVAAGASYFTGFNLNLPSFAPLVGTNTFHLIAEDVTFPPYNQAPHPPAGDTCTAINYVVANAP